MPLLEADGRQPRRDTTEERRWINWYLSTEVAGSVERAEALAFRMAPMRPECRLSVLLPCRNEAQYVTGMLNMLRYQYHPNGNRLDPAGYEILVLCNTLENEPRDRTAKRAGAVAAISEVPIHVMEYLHPADEYAPLTTARKILADVAVLRSLRRGRQDGPLFLACEDADILWMDPCQLSLQISALDEAPGLDAVRGQQDRCPWLLVPMPIILIMRRSWNFLETYLSRRSLRPDRNPLADFNWNRLVTSGWNTAFTAEAYARIGGYSPDRRFEEDMDIGESLSVLRAFERQGQLVPQVNTVGWTPTRSEGSPRRWVYRVVRNVEPYLDHDNYDNFFNLRHEASIKFGTVDNWICGNRDLLDLGPGNVRLLADLLSRDLVFAQKVIKESGKADLVYRRILHGLGFAEADAAIVGNRLEILRVDGPMAQLERIKARRLSAYADSLLSGRRRSWWTTSRGVSS